MKKNLRIVSVAVSTVSADATTADVAENPVDVTPSLTLTAKNGSVNGSLKGTISASFGG